MTDPPDTYAVPAEAAAALRDLHDAMRAVDAARAPSDAYDDLHRLVLAVFRLGLALERDPSAAAPAALRADGDSLQPLIPLLSYYMFRWEQNFYGPWEARWRTACEVRSGLEFIRVLYAGTSLEAGSDELDPELLDGLMRERAVHDGGVPDAEIPGGIPPLHWWWWAPDPPPAE